MLIYVWSCISQREMADFQDVGTVGYYDSFKYNGAIFQASYSFLGNANCD